MRNGTRLYEAYVAVVARQRHHGNYFGPVEGLSIGSLCMITCRIAAVPLASYQLRTGGWLGRSLHCIQRMYLQDRELHYAFEISHVSSK